MPKRFLLDNKWVAWRLATGMPAAGWFVVWGSYGEWVAATSGPLFYAFGVFEGINLVFAAADKS